jgi:uncharacterized protein (DUF58 family)
MNWNLLKRKQPSAESTNGAYADLDQLVRLRFATQDFSLRPTQPVTSVLSGRYGSKLRGRGMDFVEIRRYQSGDDTRTMDWKVTARTGQPHVRVCAEEKDRAVLMVVDQRQNMFFGTKRQMKSVTAAECGAIGVWRALASGDRAGAVIFNDTEAAVIKPQRSEVNAMAILGHIVRMNHALKVDASLKSNPQALNNALRRAAQMAKHDVLVVIVSDMAGVNADSERLIAQIAEHNDVLTLMTHDHYRLNAINNALNVSDGIQQTEVDFTDKPTRTHLEADFKNEQRRLEKHLRRLAAPMLMISNGEDTVQQIRKYFGVPMR